MKKRRLFTLLSVSTLLVSACSQMSEPSPSNSSALNPFLTLGGIVTEKGFKAYPELAASGWKYVAPGVALRSTSDKNYEYVLTHTLISSKTLQILEQNSISSTANLKSTYEAMLKDIEPFRKDINDTKVLKFQKELDSVSLSAQDSHSIGYFYQIRYGCQGTVTAQELDPGNGAKAFADVNCNHGYPAVVEMWASAGSGSESVVYKAFESRNRLDNVIKEGTAYCKARSKLTIIEPGTVTIGGGISIGGGTTVAGPTIQGNMNGSISWQKAPLITYTAYHNSGC